MFSLGFAFLLLAPVYARFAFETPIVLLDVLLVLVYIERGFRYSIFLVCYLIAYSTALYLPLQAFDRKLKEFTASQKIIRYRIQKFHYLFVFFFQKFMLMNEKCIRTFYTTGVCIHLFVNVAFISGLMMHNYDRVFRSQIISIVIIEIVIIFMAAYALISLSANLTKPVPEVFKLINRVRYRKLGEKIKNWTFYEMIYTDQPMKFQFIVSAIDRNSLFLFFLFYSSQLMAFIKGWLKSGLREKGLIFTQ